MAASGADPRIWPRRLHAGRGYRYIEINRYLRRRHAEIVADVIANIERLGGMVDRDRDTDLLTVNGEFSTSLVLARCRKTETGHCR